MLSEVWGVVFFLALLDKFRTVPFVFYKKPPRSLEVATYSMAKLAGSFLSALQGT